MNFNQIVPGQWYETARGEGLCHSVLAGRGAYFEFNGKLVWLKPSEVKHALAKGQEPTPAVAALDAGIPTAWVKEYEKLEAVAKMLLVALKSAVAHLDADGCGLKQTGNPELLDSLHLAIAKAEGKAK